MDCPWVGHDYFFLVFTNFITWIYQRTNNVVPTLRETPDLVHLQAWQYVDSNWWIDELIILEQATQLYAFDIPNAWWMCLIEQGIQPSPTLGQGRYFETIPDHAGILHAIRIGTDNLSESPVWNGISTSLPEKKDLLMYIPVLSGDDYRCWLSPTRTLPISKNNNKATAACTRPDKDKPPFTEKRLPSWPFLANNILLKQRNNEKKVDSGFESSVWLATYQKV